MIHRFQISAKERPISPAFMLSWRIKSSKENDRRPSEGEGRMEFEREGGGGGEGEERELGGFVVRVMRVGTRTI